MDFNSRSGKPADRTDFLGPTFEKSLRIVSDGTTPWTQLPLVANNRGDHRKVKKIQKKVQ